MVKSIGFDIPETERPSSINWAKIMQNLFLIVSPPVLLAFFTQFVLSGETDIWEMKTADSKALRAKIREIVPDIDTVCFDSQLVEQASQAISEQISIVYNSRNGSQISKPLELKCSYIDNSPEATGNFDHQHFNVLNANQIDPYYRFFGLGRVLGSNRYSVKYTPETTE